MSTSGVKGSVWTSDSLQSVCTPMEVNDRDLKAQINYMEKKEEDSFMSTDLSPPYVRVALPPSKKVSSEVVRNVVHVRCVPAFCHIYVCHLLGWQKLREGPSPKSFD